VTNLERLLLATDDSGNGKFAAQLAGIIAGSGGKPTTILNLTDKAKRSKPEATDEYAAKARQKSEQKSAKGSAKPGGEHFEEAVKSAAEATTALEAHSNEEKPAKVEVITRRHPLGPEAVAGEARKGYDLLVLGIANTRDPKGGFSRDLSLITQSFEGPLAVVDTRSRGRDLSRLRYGRILIPVTGTEVSRRGVEVGLTLARASDAQVTALYVTRANSGASRNNPSRRLAMRRNELAVLKEIAALAERYDVPLRSTTRADMAPDEAILREAGRGYDIIVLGVSRRSGDVLFFGNTAAAVLERSPTSNLFVAS
jgi:nucleotide-binding universal stress UspA family protein